jgi:hypothetical protein
MRSSATVLRAALLALLVLLASSRAVAEDYTVASACAEIERSEWVMSASDLFFARALVAKQPAVAYLISQGTSVGPAIVQRFDDLPASNSAHSCYAYVLEKMHYKAALKSFNAFLGDPRNHVVDFMWAVAFVSYARTELEGQD